MHLINAYQTKRSTHIGQLKRIAKHSGHINLLCFAVADAISPFPTLRCTRLIRHSYSNLYMNLDADFHFCE